MRERLNSFACSSMKQSILAQLHHPNIAANFRFGRRTANGSYYLAMEYVPGFDLMTISLEHERQGELMGTGAVRANHF